MHVLPVPTRQLLPGDDLASIALESSDLHAGDILVVSSKALATVENAAIDLTSLTISTDAKVWSEKSGRSPEFCEAVVRETKRQNGRIIHAAQGAMLTELKPARLLRGAILTANAGLDESNVEKGHAIGWPKDPVHSIAELRKKIPFPIGVILSDTSVLPRRTGVIAQALAVSGLDPFKSEVGSKDLFGRPLEITIEALADQLAIAGNMVMGNAAQSTPAAIIRDHGIALSDFEGWVEGIDPKEDLFRTIL